jgi:hypothetical protein
MYDRRGLCGSAAEAVNVSSVSSVGTVSARNQLGDATDRTGRIVRNFTIPKEIRRYLHNLEDGRRTMLRLGAAIPPANKLPKSAART